MFKFLKEKLKSALNIFKKKVKEEAPEEEQEIEKEVEVEVEEEIAPVGEAAAPDKKIVSAEKKLVAAEKKEVVVEERKRKEVEKEEFEARGKKKFAVEKEFETVEKEKGLITAEVAEEKKRIGFLEKIKKIKKKVVEKILTKKISPEKFRELFWELELALLENNVAIEVIDKIKKDLEAELVNTPLPRGKVEKAIEKALLNSIKGLFEYKPYDLVELVRGSEQRPYVICFLGINGSGKTTTIAKLAKLFKENGINVVIAAGDTFRAAAIQQLEKHAEKVGVKLIKHSYGSDPAAVAYDAIAHAKATKKDVVLIDTAGRLHSNVDLMDELRKIVRVAKPHLKIFVGEAIVGNDCVEQAKQFEEAVGIDGVILAKADVDEKGGAAVSISYVVRKPILYLGSGQGYDDIVPFSSELIIKNLGLEEAEI